MEVITIVGTTLVKLTLSHLSQSVSQEVIIMQSLKISAKMPKSKDFAVWKCHFSKIMQKL